MRIVNKFVIKCQKNIPQKIFSEGSTFSAFSALPKTALEGSPVTVGTPFIEASVFRLSSCAMKRRNSRA